MEKTVQLLPCKPPPYNIRSLVPRPPLLLPSICVHNNTREQKTGEKRGRPGSIHHVSGHEVEGPIFKYIRTKLESDREFLTVQDE